MTKIAVGLNGNRLAFAFYGEFKLRWLQNNGGNILILLKKNAFDMAVSFPCFFNRIEIFIAAIATFNRCQKAFWDATLKLVDFFNGTASRINTP